MIRAPAREACRIFDPCCGEGSALADIRQGLLNIVAGEEGEDLPPPHIEALGVEFDKERAWQAKKYLDRIIHADIHDVVVKPRSIGLMFLNPPYGYGVSDQAHSSAAEVDSERAERLERTFLRKATPLVAQGGVLVYIIPFYALDAEIRAHLARNYDDVRAYMAPERKFKQCVVLGTRRRAGHASKDVLDMLTRAQASEEGAPMLPESWEGEPYMIPPTDPKQEFDFHAVRIDAEQLGDELQRFGSSLLWDGLETHFNQAKGACRPPLREMTPWHLALSLAAGQITGHFKSDSGREFLIKGDTFKQKARSTSTEVDEKGNVSQTITMLDKFVPVINAIEFTPDHRRGQIVKIA